MARIAAKGRLPESAPAETLDGATTRQISNKATDDKTIVTNPLARGNVILCRVAGILLGPKYKFVNSPPFDVTNWDPALTQQVLTAAIAKNKNINVIISDFGPSLVGALPVFKKESRDYG